MNVQSINNDIKTKQWMKTIKECRESWLPVKTWYKQNNVCERTYYMTQKIKNYGCWIWSCFSSNLCTCRSEESEKRKYCYNQKWCANWVLLSYGYKSDNEYYRSLIMLGDISKEAQYFGKVYLNQAQFWCFPW